VQFSSRMDTDSFTLWVGDQGGTDQNGNSGKLKVDFAREQTEVLSGWVQIDSGCLVTCPGHLCVTFGEL
jgi:hypothetical protein